MLQPGCALLVCSTVRAGTLGCLCSISMGQTYRHTCCNSAAQPPWYRCQQALRRTSLPGHSPHVLPLRVPHASPLPTLCSFVCFPSSATVQTADRGQVAMPDLRPGDRVLSVGWDGRPQYQVGLLPLLLPSHPPPCTLCTDAVVVLLERAHSGAPKVRLSTLAGCNLKCTVAAAGRLAFLCFWLLALLLRPSVACESRQIRVPRPVRGLEQEAFSDAWCYHQRLREC